MPKVLPLSPGLITDRLHEQIVELAKLNFAPSDIAIKLGFNKHAFVALWKDKDSDLYESYYKGKLDFKKLHQEAVLEAIDEGNITAVQIYDKEAEAQAFEDIKKEFFGE
ncbi:MAG: hypothetical protein HRT69_17040 [Flavobacteriaceae bacterium]|nr:hypothetical protein [Flavobacteriaceae bacterium]